MEGIPGAFQFLDPGEPNEGELSLVLAHRHPANLMRGWAPSYEFEMRRVGVSGAVGHLSYRAVTTRTIELYSGHFGYGVEPGHRGRHLAERSVRLLLPFVRRHGMQSVWITCNPENAASRRTCERLGATLEEIVALPPDNDMYRRGERVKCRYLLRL